jgi:hypothetical protein
MIKGYQSSCYFTLVKIQLKKRQQIVIHFVFLFLTILLNLSCQHTKPQKITELFSPNKKIQFKQQALLNEEKLEHKSSEITELKQKVSIAYDKDAQEKSIELLKQNYFLIIEN